MLNALLGVAGSFLGGGGGGASTPPPPPPSPIDNKVKFGDVTFGPKYIGDTAVKEAAAIESVAAGGVARWLPWAVGGLVAIVALVLVLPNLGAKRR